MRSHLSAEQTDAAASTRIDATFKAMKDVGRLAHTGIFLGVIVCPACRGGLHFQAHPARILRTAGRCETPNCIEWWME